MMNIESVIATTKYEPRPYQVRIIQTAYESFFGLYKDRSGRIQDACSSVLIESPTGSGKTCMSLLALKVIQHQIPDLTIGWVAMRRNLLKQAAHENIEKGVNVQNIHFVSMYDKFPAALHQAKEEGKPIMLVPDEAHHDATNSMANLHNALKPKFVLGMTATPFRTDSLKLCFNRVIKDAGIHQLIQGGYLSPYVHYTIPKWSPSEVAKHYAASPDRWGKSIFFFKNLANCYLLQKHLNRMGFSSEVVTGESDCDQQLDDFRADKVKCLINCMKLVEGFDCPELKTAWIRDSGRGPTVQMGGRAFRKHPSLPFKQIVQSEGTHWPFMKTAHPQSQHVWKNGEWRSLEANSEQIERTAAACQFFVATQETAMPKFILAKGAKKASRWNNQPNQEFGTGQRDRIIDHD